MEALVPINTEAENGAGDLSALLRMRPLDVHLEELLRRMDPAMPPSLALAVRVLSARVREGHVCLDLAGRDGVWPKAVRMAGLRGGLDAWRREMRASPLVGDHVGAVRPLVLMGNRLYLRRYFRAEAGVAEGLLDRARESVSLPDLPVLQATLDRFFPEKDAGVNMQKVAAFAAVRSTLCVIVGGPGTGKTTTVCRLLAALATLAESPPEVALAAPTGKAAGRLGEAITAGKLRLGDMEETIRKVIPESALTVHRLLGMRPGRRPRHHRENPLAADVVVVDEVSMVDLFLMAKLVDALKPGARLILLGDRFQLASVLPGAVLGEICKAASGERSAAFIRDFEAVLRMPAPFTVKKGLSPMADCVVTLDRSWRFEASGGIGRLADSLNRGDDEAVVRMLETDEDGQVGWRSLEGRGHMESGLRDLILEGFSDLVKAGDPQSAFAALERFRILCVLREGPAGAGGVNALVEKVLEQAGLLSIPGPWYAGRPVMVVKNDPTTGLFNGDVGITLKDGESGELLVYFPSETGALLAFHPLRLPDVETVFAMTVHKSQGSEFDRVLLVLPDRDAPVLTREILYTAVTRARKKVLLAGSRDMLRLGTDRIVRRSSGLGDALWRVTQETDGG